MRWFLVFVGIGALILLPNLMWLATSTLRIENKSGSSLSSLSYRACETEYPLAPLKRGSADFEILPSCGEDTIVIILGEKEFCQIYVEGEMYHVDVEVHSPDNVTCKYDDPISGLFLAKMLL